MQPHPQPQECCICFESDINLFKTNCNHYFHTNCLLRWCQSQHNTCPICRSFAPMSRQDMQMHCSSRPVRQSNSSIVNPYIDHNYINDNYNDNYNNNYNRHFDNYNIINNNIRRLIHENIAE